MRKLAALVLAVAAFAVSAVPAFAANGVSHSHGAASHGNAVSSGATPQPQ